MTLMPKLTELAATVGTNPVTLANELASMVFAVAQRAAIAYLLIGFVDYAYQRWQHDESLRMSQAGRQGRDRRSQSLPAEVKGAQRRRQMQQARARMMAAVPQADVVVTNPTHFAVALEVRRQPARPRRRREGPGPDRAADPADSPPSTTCR